MCTLRRAVSYCTVACRKILVTSRDDQGGTTVQCQPANPRSLDSDSSILLYLLIRDSFSSCLSIVVYNKVSHSKLKYSTSQGSVERFQYPILLRAIALVHSTIPWMILFLYCLRNLLRQELRRCCCS
mmetsp:Transcript_22969/g.37290  ORF Transcript_22969/g.37290 Transcript_22969/m.37290 type:complete len:127 (-) Transcript_22969:828-1208(-)